MSLAYVKYLCDQLDEALRLLNHVVRCFAVLINGIEHPEVATAYTYIGLVYLKQKKYDLSKTFFGKAISINESIFGVEHKVTAASFDHLAQACLATDDFHGALNAYRKVYKFYAKEFGPEDSKTVQVFEALKIFTQRAVHDAKQQKLMAALST